PDLTDDGVRAAQSDAAAGKSLFPEDLKKPKVWPIRELMFEQVTKQKKKTR
ncbi:unnamed protein product, partial [Amoebophrya sp. A120]